MHASFRRVLEQDLSQAASLIGHPCPTSASYSSTTRCARCRRRGGRDRGHRTRSDPGVPGAPRPDSRTVRRAARPPRAGIPRRGTWRGSPTRGSTSTRAARTTRSRSADSGSSSARSSRYWARVTGITQARRRRHHTRSPSNPIVKERSVSARITDVRDLIRGGSRGNHRSAESGPRIVAYVVRGAGFDEAELFSRLRERLPHYMIPAFVVPVDSIPMNHNGKVDRKELPAASAANCLREPRRRRREHPREDPRRAGPSWRSSRTSSASPA
ncbi:hypothetical protein ACFSNO_26930 [Streptomyces cirratus]